MSEKMTKANDTVEIDVRRLALAVWHRAWIVVLSAVLCAVLFFVGTFYLITPQYRSSAMFYVNNSTLSLGEAAISIDSGDITAAKNLVASYIVILKTRESLSAVLDYSGVDRSYGELRSMISAASVNSTEIFEVVVTSADPVEAEQIANAIAYVLPKRISSIVEGSSAKVVEYAVVAASPSSPSYPKNTVYGLIAGLLLSIGILVVRELFDVTIRSENDIEQCCAHPVLAAVPDMIAPSKGNAYYYYGGYGEKTHKKSGSSAGQKAPALIGRDISFAAAEAYKLLRTKLQFSFTDEITCPVIGISSALAGEGKSLSAINLAYSLAQLDKRVLLMDGDMRRPSLAAKLRIAKNPGLSNYLTGQVELDEIIQACGNDVKEGCFDAITSGRNPPNPIELLSSPKMARMLSQLRESYDYIIMDLPPVGEVSDSMVAAKLVDGVLLVVRQNYGSSVALSQAVRQFEFVSSRILGVVLNCVSDSGRGYGKKYYRYRKYYTAYEGSHTSLSETSKNTSMKKD